MSIQAKIVGFICAVLVTMTMIVGLCSPQAQAEDQRRCVSKVEYQGLQFGQSRAALEARWEVQNLGQHVLVFNTFDVIAYPRCGSTFDQAWYGAIYSPGNGVVMKAQYQNPNVRPERLNN